MLVVLIKLFGDSCFAETQLQMSHSKAARAAQMDLNYSQAVVCGPRTKLDFGERLFINVRERHMDARATHSQS